MKRVAFPTGRAGTLSPSQRKKQTEVECQDCGLDPMCSILEYAEEDSGVPEGILLRRRPVDRGETIFRKGDLFHSIYAVKSGSFKSYVPHVDHPDQVVGFHLYGELIGSEGMAEGSYPYTARALERSSVCELRLEKLSQTGRSLEELQGALIKMLGKEVAFGHELIATLVHQSAEQRIAGFILSMSERLQRRGIPSVEFNISMSRSDIGNYLGLAGETVSRILTKMQKQGVIRLQHKRIVVLDPRELDRLAQE
jgi:CRP/FNR family transcriptional regulator